MMLTCIGRQTSLRKGRRGAARHMICPSAAAIQTPTPTLGHAWCNAVDQTYGAVNPASL
jgi:hypothetical protein